MDLNTSDGNHDALTRTPEQLGGEARTLAQCKRWRLQCGHRAAWIRYLCCQCALPRAATVLTVPLLIPHGTAPVVGGRAVIRENLHGVRQEHWDLLDVAGLRPARQLVGHDVSDAWDVMCHEGHK